MLTIPPHKILVHGVLIHSYSLYIHYLSALHLVQKKIPPLDDRAIVSEEIKLSLKPLFPLLIP